jgi:hypothetical protein
MGGGWTGLVEHGRRRQETDKLEIGWAGCHRLQPGDQAARRGAAGSDVDTTTGPDRRQRLLRIDEPGTEAGNAHLVPHRLG